MEREQYYLLKFINEVQKIGGRKKLQKLIYILEYLGCPTKNRFNMHYYGPYSSDLALELDTLVENKYIEETKINLTYGKEYIYKITESGQQYIQFLEEIIIDENAKKKASNWVNTFKKLNSSYKVFDLELTSTLLYWLDVGHSLDKAKQFTLEQKNIEASNDSFKKAVKLAENLFCNTHKKN